MLDPPMSTVKTGTEDFVGEGRLTLIGNVAMVEGVFIDLFATVAAQFFDVAPQAHGL